VQAPNIRGAFRIAVVSLSAASFWLWMVLPLPPEDDPGLSFQNVGQWVATIGILAFITAWIERNAFRAACLIALGEPIAFLPYALFGFAYRRSRPVEVRWDSLFDIMAVPALLFYFLLGMLITILPALAGSVFSRYLRK
jgi:hypothetical protein